VDEIFQFAPPPHLTLHSLEIESLHLMTPYTGRKMEKQISFPEKQLKKKIPMVKKNSGRKDTTK
jgi:hypothetical protein